MLSCLASTLLYLRLSNGQIEASYFFENSDSKSAGAQLAGAEQNESQSFYSVQRGRVRTSFCRQLQTRAGLQQLQHIRQNKLNNRLLNVLIKLLFFIFQVLMFATKHQSVSFSPVKAINQWKPATSMVWIFACSWFLPRVASVNLQCVSSCWSNLRDVSSSPWWVSWTSRSRKLLNPNKTSSRQSEKSTSRLCKEFWAMRRISSSMWIVNLPNRTNKNVTIRNSRYAAYFTIRFE